MLHVNYNVLCNFFLMIQFKILYFSASSDDNNCQILSISLSQIPT